MSGSKNCGTFTQWNSMQQRERRSLYPLQQHGWNLREPAIELFYQLSLRPNCWWTKTAEVLTCFYFYVCMYVFMYVFNILLIMLLQLSHFPPSLKINPRFFPCQALLIYWWILGPLLILAKYNLRIDTYMSKLNVCLNHCTFCKQNGIF